MEGSLDDFCIVICGEWICSSNGEWKLEISNKHFSRVVPIHEGIKLEQFNQAIVEEFGVKAVKPLLSYSLPNRSMLSTKEKTPPVLVTSEVGLLYYIKALRENRGLNLFVKFEETTDRYKLGEDREDRRKSCETLGGSCKRKSDCSYDTGSSSKNGEAIGGEISSAGSKTPIIMLTPGDDDFFDELLEVEAKIGCSSGFKSAAVDKDEEEEFIDVEDEFFNQTETEEKEEKSDMVDESMPCGGYDKDFWSNFLKDVYAGSNAEELMTTGGVDVRYRSNHMEAGNLTSEGAFNGSKTPEVVMCTGSGVFDHAVLVNGGGTGVKPEFSQKSEHIENDGGSQRKGKPVRKLEEVDDEEFDIPPLFEDIEYEVDNIPDLDIDDDGKGLYKGKVYASREDAQIGMAIYAIKNMFHFKQTRTKYNYFVLSCSDEKCDWRILSTVIRGTGYYEIKKLCLQHTCSVETRGQYMKKATSRVIASVYKAKFSDPTNGPVPMDLQQLILEDLRVDASYHKCWRVRETAMADMSGTDEDSYSSLAEYLHLLKVTNPGSITHIETEDEDEGKERFLYMFLAFGASIAGFKHLRKILVVDGTHLKGKYKGVLLTASGQDANFQVFPLAFAVVDSENDESWTWFFSKLERIIADSKSLTILSDRQSSINVGIKRIFPLANHGACIIHLCRNIQARYKNKGLTQLVKNAGYEFTTSKFKELYGQINALNQDCGHYLHLIGMAHWSRVYFQGQRYNLMTSNIAETLNKALGKGRSSHIVELIRFIRSMLTRWFNARRKKSAAHTGPVPPEVDKQITKLMLSSNASKVARINSWCFEIVGRLGGRHVVDLEKKQCTCKSFS
ncbi:unnamed protein product [Arabidopsis arenosa]|uniref:Mutator-like transposase n=1 Tax=Arabidopsis arenosa TaxID=38785 RepID=A0A8S1ZKB3_ARAAE|nr:unnamed protein product [Arabidopsis arenosa]